MFFMHPLALIASEVATGTSSTSTTSSALVTQIPNDFLFTKDMYNGLDSAEVKMLQIFLNADPQTLVKSTGPGSPGNETTYFGSATQNAVERFQVIYKSVILDPLGFSNPTGIIGARSRSVLNQVLDNLRNNIPANTNIFIGRVVQNTGTSTAATVDNNLLFQSIGTGSTSLAVATTATSTASTTPLRIETTSIPSATVGSSYYAVIQASGGDNASSYGWGVLYGSLPNGITPRGTTCISSQCKGVLLLSGTPTSAGSYTFIIRVTSSNQYVTKEMVINIQDRAGTVTQNTTNTSTTNSNTSTSGDSSSNTSTSSSTSSSSSNIGAALAVVGGAVAVSSIASSLSSSGSTAGSSGSSGTSGGIRTVFGGPISYVQYCTCTTFILLFIYDYDLKSVIQLLYIPGVSTLKDKYNIFHAGPTVLGGYTPGSTPCMVYIGEGCTQIGSPTGIIDTLRGVGSSAS